MTRKLLLGASIALALVLGGSLLWNRREVTVGSPAGAAPAPAAGGAAGSAPLAVDVHVVRVDPLEVHVPATGTLRGRESVELVSELSRRLQKAHAEEGATVRKGELLFELDASDLRAQIAKLDVQTRLAEVMRQRTERLQAEGLSNQQELDLSRARVDELASERQVLLVTLSKTLIRAPFAGTLGLRRVSEGAWVTPSTILATLQDTSALKLDFTLPERYASSVRAGGAFRFRVDGHPEAFGAKIAALEPSVDAATRSLLVRGIVEGTTGLLPGAAATIELPLRVEEALLVPAIAVVPGVEGRRVYVFDQGKARSVPVEVGFRTADRAQVLSGLRAGDQVITTNLLRLRDGVAVRVTGELAP